MKKYKKNKSSSGDIFIKFLEKGISSLVNLIFPQGGFAVFKTGELEKRWESIRMLSGSMAIIEADKLTDTILKKARIEGNSMAERIRKTEKLVRRDTYQGLWDAHKLRNSLVHDMDMEVNERNVNEALSKIKRYLVELGAFKNG